MFEAPGTGLPEAILLLDFCLPPGGTPFYITFSDRFPMFDAPRTGAVRLLRRGFSVAPGGTPAKRTVMLPAPRAILFSVFGLVFRAPYLPTILAPRIPLKCQLQDRWW